MFKRNWYAYSKIKQFIDWSMDGESTILQRLELMKQQKINVLQHIQDTEKNLKKIQQKITKYEHEITSIAQNTK